VALALYRKYRPATFAEVVGQEHVTEPLRTALAAGRINHAYLFSGPRGCGKTSSARILARSLNCELGPTPEPCGSCPSCIALAPGGPGNIDVTELDAASHGGVDDTRELRDRAFFAPAESRYRVFIVDEAHMITTQGFNALLKIVEEPPEHLVFVFATTEPDKVLVTIRSRTHHYPFRLIPPGTLRALLERICADQGAVVAPAVFPLVIRAGGGSARDSLSLLDQLLAGAGPEGVTYDRAVALLGVTDVAIIDDVVDALAAADRAAVFEAVDRLVEAGHDPRRFAADLLQRLRDLTLLQAVPEAVDRGLVEAADDELTRMVEQAGRLGPATLARYGEIVHTGLAEMRGATAPRLLLELLCARMLLPAATTAEPGLLERLERMERRVAIAPGPDAAEVGGDGRRSVARPGATGGGAEPRAAERDAATPSGSPAERVATATGATRPMSDAGSGQPTDRRSAERGRGVPPPAAGPAPGDGPAQRQAAPGPGRSAPADGSGDGTAAGEAPPAARRAAGDGSAEPRRRSSGDEPTGTRRPSDGSAEPPPGSPGREARPARAGAAPEPPARPAAADAAAAGDGRGGGETASDAGAASRSTPAVRALDAAAVRSVWSEILAAARPLSRSVEAMLVNATVRAVEDDTLVLHIPAPSLAKRLAETRNTDVVAAALHSVLGVRWRVRCESGDRPAPERPAPPAAAPRPAPVRRSAPAGAEPLPPEPPDDDEPPEDEETMLAQAAADTAAGRARRRDPEEVAMELLTAELGARAIDPGPSG